MKSLLICLCIMFSTSVFADGSDDGFLYPANVPTDIPEHKVELHVVPKQKIDLNEFNEENCKDKPVNVPEPEVLGLLGVGLVAFAVWGKRKQK